MRLTYDAEGDMGYLYLVDEIGPGEVKDSVVVDDEDLPGDLVVDLDADGRVLGIEIFSASKQLRPELLAAAVRPGEGPG